MHIFICVHVNRYLAHLNQKMMHAKNDVNKCFCLVWGIQSHCGQGINPSDGLPPPCEENFSTETSFLAHLVSPLLACF